MCIRDRLKSRVDIFFYGAITESNINTEELAGMNEEAIGYKIFLADGPLYIGQERLPEALRAVEAISTSKPIVVHCEDQELIENRREELEKNKDVQAGAEVHSWLRPAQAELSAVRRVLSIASGIRNSINIAHISPVSYTHLTLPTKRIV